MNTISLKSLRGKKLYYHGACIGVCASVGFNFLVGKVAYVFVASSTWLPWTYRYDGYVQFSHKGRLELYKEQGKDEDYTGTILYTKVFTEGGTYLGKVQDVFLSEDLQYLVRLYVQHFFFGKTYLIHRTQIVSMKKGQVIVRDNTVEDGASQKVLAASVVSSIPMMKKL